MTITYLGHASFKIKGKDVTIVIDPYDDSSTGKKFPKQTDADILLMTHNHPDHHNREGVSETAFVIDGPGEYDVKDVPIEGIFSYHDKKNGEERGMNTMYVIDLEGVKILHVGDLGTTLSEEQLEKIGNIHILMIPVGGKYTIDAHDAAKVISEIEPSTVIPMHYGNDKLGLDSVDTFLKEMGVEKEIVKSLKVTKDDFSDESEGSKVIVMES